MRDASHDREGDGHVFDDIIPEISTTKPGDIQVTITKKAVVEVAQNLIKLKPPCKMYLSVTY